MASLLRRSLRIRDERERKLQAGSSSKLPNEILMEIQARLPAKPFYRFKAVSKVWCSLSSYAFLQNKNLQDPAVLGLFHNVLFKDAGMTDTVVLESFSDNKNEADVILSAFQHYDWKRLKDCCNGHLLLCCWNNRTPSDPHYYVYNPANRKSISLPRPKRYKYHNYISDVFSLAYDPAIDTEIYVIWFRKVLTNGEFYTVLHTFSSKKGRWTTGKKLWPSSMFWEHDRSIYVGGKVYRLTWRRELFSLDPRDGTYTIIQLPDAMPGSIMIPHARSLWLSQGLLNYLRSDEDGKLKIWELRDHEKKEWILKYHVQETAGIWSPNWYIASYGGFGLQIVSSLTNELAKVIAYHPDRDVIYIPTRRRKLQSLNLKTGELTEICNLPYGGQLYFWFYRPSYV